MNSFWICGLALRNEELCKLCLLSDDILLFISIIITHDVKVELSKWVKARQVSPLPLSKQRTTVCTQIIVPLLSIFKIQKHHMIYSKVGSLVTLIMYSKFDN